MEDLVRARPLGGTVGRVVLRAAGEWHTHALPNGSDATEASWTWRDSVCSHDEVRFDFETRASPDQVRRALTDFTDRRLHTWRRSLDPKTYELRDQGEHWAVARESSRGSPAWVVSRYDWSDPDMVRWWVTESSYGGGGEGFVRITPREDGGSSVHAEWSAVNVRRQKSLLFLIHHGPMRMLFSRMWASALNRYAREDTY